MSFGMSEDQRKRAAENALTRNTTTLNRALSLDEPIFRAVVNACVDDRLVTKGQRGAFLDTMCGKTLEARVQEFVSQITPVVGILPDYLDKFLLILFNAGSTLTQNAAKEIAKKYGYNLPNYESAGGSVADSVGPAPKLPKYEPAGGSVPAVVSDSAVGPSPNDATNAGSVQSLSPQFSEQGKEEVASDFWGFGSKKEKKKDEEKAEDDIMYKYKVNETEDHGVVLIINNVNFKNKDKDRESSNEDAKRLEKVFKGLRYQVVVHKNLTSQQMKTKVSGIAAGVVTEEHDSFICCILSHGNPEGIEGVDDETVTVAELVKSVNSKECSALCGKPKIFFFQACRGTEVPEPSAADSSVPWLPNEEEEMVADGVRALPPEADFLFGFSTSDGNVAARGVYTGSQYIKALCEFLDPKYSSRFSLDELLLLVNYKVSGNPIDYKKSYKYHQMPEIRSTLRGKFYFKK